MNQNIMEERPERILLAGVHTGRQNALEDTTEESMAELSELAKTAGGTVVASVVQNKSDLESTTYMGEGKLLEIKNAIETLDVDCVIFDDELSPVQIRNITDLLEVKVLDRSMLILDIFAMRAQSGAGKLQVELAQLKYRLPRLRGLGTEMSRTGAGIGTRGPGETKLETDRRHIHRRISALEDELAELEKHRNLLRNRRKKDEIITVCLVGYTNAGKSTILNALTEASVLAENKLFATLDPTSRLLELADNRKVLLVDTVGFIRKLPHHLVEAFKSTLEEAVVADVLVEVVDASSPERENHIRVVESVLKDIGAVGKPIVYAYNKWDQVADFDAGLRGGTVCLSAKNHEGLDVLVEAIAEAAPGKKQEIKVLLPYSMGSLVSALHENQKILSEQYLQDGTELVLLADSRTYEQLREYIVE